MRLNRVEDKKCAKERFVCRHYESGFTLLEVSFTLILVPLFIGLIMQFIILGQNFYDQPRTSVHTTPQLIVRKLLDSRDCDVVSGRLVGTYVRPDGTTWTWTLKQIQQNLVMVGDEGGNLLFLRGIDTYQVESIGKGFRIRWSDATGQREKSVMCMRQDTL